MDRIIAKLSLVAVGFGGLFNLNLSGCDFHWSYLMLCYDIGSSSKLFSKAQTASQCKIYCANLEK